MKCPNCYSDAPDSAATCPRCDWALRAPTPSGASAAWGTTAMRGGWEADAATDSAELWNAQPTPTPAWNQAPQQPAPDWRQPPPGLSGAAVPPPPMAMPGSWSASGQPGPASGSAVQVALTDSQKRTLLFLGGLPLLFVGFMLFIGIWLLPNNGNTPMPGFFYIVMLVMITFLLFTAVQPFRDISSGYALQEIQRAARLRRVRNKNSTSYYVYFDNKQKLNINRTLYRNLREGALYSFTYARYSKRVFSADPVMSQV